MGDTKGQAKEQFARLQRTMQPRLSSLQERLQAVPDRIQNNLPESLQNLPERLPRSFPRSSSSEKEDDPPPPVTPQISRAPALPLSYSSPPPPAAVAAAEPLSSPQSQIPKAPAATDPAYNPELAFLASKILYRSGTDPVSGGPLLILCAAAFPDANHVDYTVLLPYVLANLPGDDELSTGTGYSVVFFAAGGERKAVPGATPSWKWTLQAYTLVGVIREIAGTLVEDRRRDVADSNGQLGRAVRKQIRRLWIVHERNWIRTIFELMAGVVSAKFKKKVVHVNNLSELALHIDITTINIPPAVYIVDRKLGYDVVLPGFPKAPVFGYRPFPAVNPQRMSDNICLPMVLIDTSNYIRRRCLKVEGLFRVPPSQAVLEVARDCYDRHTQLPWEEWGPHTAAGLIKLYYRTLPEPMIPQECYEQMHSLVAMESDPERMVPEHELAEVRFEVVHALLTTEATTLPSHSRILFLRHLLPLLADIAAHRADNKMDPTNLAVCVAASMARSNDMIADAKASAGIRKFIEIGIQRIDELAPKQPVRRAAPYLEKRRSQTLDMAGLNLTVDPPTYYTRQVLMRKKVPSPTSPRQRPASMGSSVCDSPVMESPLENALSRILPPPSPKPEEMRRGSAPYGPRPAPVSGVKTERSASYDSVSPLTPILPPVVQPKPVQYQSNPIQRKPVQSQDAAFSPVPLPVARKDVPVPRQQAVPAPLVPRKQLQLDTAQPVARKQQQPTPGSISPSLYQAYQPPAVLAKPGLLPQAHALLAKPEWVPKLPPRPPSTTPDLPPRPAVSPISRPVSTLPSARIPSTTPTPRPKSEYFAYHSPIPSIPSIPSVPVAPLAAPPANPRKLSIPATFLQPPATSAMLATPGQFVARPLLRRAASANFGAVGRGRVGDGEYRPQTVRRARSQLDLDVGAGAVGELRALFEARAGMERDKERRVERRVSSSDFSGRGGEGRGGL